MRIHSDTNTTGQSKTPGHSDHGAMICDQLERLRTTLSMDVKSWSEILDVSVEDYAAIQNNSKPVSIVTLARVTDHLQLTLESLMNNRIDYRAVAARHSGDNAFLPERYVVGAMSKRRSSYNLLTATEDLLGWRARSMAMRHLQVTEAAFTNLDDVINLRFNTDLCDYLAKHYGGSHLFHQMGAYFIINNLNSPIGKALAKNKTLMELYQQFIEELVPKYWENNFRYRIVSIGPGFIRAEGVPNPDVADSLKVQNPGSASVCQTKVGLVSSVAGCLGVPFAHVEEISCVHRGDDKCVYDIDFERSSFHFEAMKTHSSLNQ